jgi:hypothetical protein
MSVTNSTHQTRHVTVVATNSEATQAADDIQQGLVDATRLVVRHTIGTPLHEQIASSVLERIADLDALHDTACAVYDCATAALDQARKDLAAAAAALTQAEDTWSKAGQEMDAVARAVSSARKAAGLVYTADGYRQQDSR